MEPIELTVPDIDAQIEEKVNAEDVSFAITGVDFKAIPAGIISIIDLVVKADRRRTYTAQAELDAKKDADFAAYRTQMEQRVSELTREYNELEQECLEVRDELKNESMAKINALAERDEARSNRDNAATQLDEANKEVARLNSLVGDYQKAKVFGEREAQNIIETNETEAAAINDAIRNFYTSFENFGAINKVYKEDGSFELIKTDKLQSEWAQVGGSETSQNSFRDEAAEAGAEDSGVPSAEVSVTPPPFGEAPFQSDLADGDTAVPEMVEDAPVTRGEFEALKRDVEALKQGQIGAAA